MGETGRAWYEVEPVGTSELPLDALDHLAEILLDAATACRAEGRSLEAVWLLRLFFDVAGERGERLRWADDVLRRVQVEAAGGHVVEVDNDRPLVGPWQAFCACGWEGPWRASEGEAERDGDRHVAAPDRPGVRLATL